MTKEAIQDDMPKESKRHLGYLGNITNHVVTRITILEILRSAPTLEALVAKDRPEWWVQQERLEQLELDQLVR